jgi:hypothetical protein
MIELGRRLFAASGGGVARADAVQGASSRRLELASLARFSSSPLRACLVPTACSTFAEISPMPGRQSRWTSGAAQGAVASGARRARDAGSSGCRSRFPRCSRGVSAPQPCRPAPPRTPIAAKDTSRRTHTQREMEAKSSLSEALLASEQAAHHGTGMVAGRYGQVGRGEWAGLQRQ